MPVLDWDPGQNPKADGELQFYVEGQDPSTGWRVSSDGRTLAPGSSGLAWPTSEPAPSDHGLESWVYPPALCTGGTAAVNGSRYLTKLYTRRARTSAAVHWAITSAGSGAVAGQNWLALYSSAGTRLGLVGIDADVSALGARRTVLAAPYEAGFVWVAWIFNAATPPSLARGGSFESTPNAGLTNATYQFAVNGTGLTTMSASLTPGSNTTSGAINSWAALE